MAGLRSLLRAPQTLTLLIAATATGCGPRPGSLGHDRYHDFGPAFAGSSAALVDTFQVRNSSSRPLKINKIIKSCNCTEVSLSKMEIPLGGSAELKMTIKPSLALGKWTVQCTLQTDDLDEPGMTYTVTYRSYPHVRFDGSTLDLGRVMVGENGLPHPGDRKETWFEIFEPVSNRVDAPGDFEAPPCLALDLSRVPVIDLLEGGTIARSRYRIGVNYAPGRSQFDGASGAHTATIAARTRSGHATSITALWSINLPLQISPDPVSFGLIRSVSGPVRRAVTLKGLDGSPFQLLTIDSDSNAVKAEKMGERIARAELTHNLVLNYQNEKLKKLYDRGQIIITTDHPRMPKITIPWSAILRE